MGDRFSPDEILKHNFMTTEFSQRRTIPKIRFKRGREVDKITSFTYGIPLIGIELLKDYCSKDKWILFPEKLVLVLRSNRKLYIYSEDEVEQIVI